MYEFIIDAASTIIKHGKSWATLAGLLFLFLRQRHIKRAIIKRLPRILRRFRDEETDRMDRIEEKVDEILLEVKEWKGNVSSSHHTTKYSAEKSKTPSTSHSVEYTPVQSVGQFINLDSERMKKIMKDFLSGKKKWLALVFLVLINGLNDTLGLELSQETIHNITDGGTIYLIIEGVLDMIRAITNALKKNENNGANQYH